jgi:hypothetical protein
MVVKGQHKKTVCEAPISKITRGKWTGDVVKVVEHLLCKCKGLSSNLSLQNLTSKEGNQQDQGDYRRTLIMSNSMSVLS